MMNKPLNGTLNPTGQKTITHKGNKPNIEAILSVTADDHNQSCAMNINLANLNLSGTEQIYVQIRSGSYSRAEEIKKRTNTESYFANISLSDISLDARPSFRVVAVDEDGLIKASSAYFKAKLDVNKPGILRIIFRPDMEGYIWKLELKDEPLIVVNKDVRKTKLINGSTPSPLFRMMMFPAVIRQIMRHVYSDASPDDESDQSWEADWKNWLKQYHDKHPDDLRTMFIDEASETAIEDLMDTVIANVAAIPRWNDLWDSMMKNEELDDED